MNINLRVSSQIISLSTNEADNITQNVQATIQSMDDKHIIEYLSNILNEYEFEKNYIESQYDQITVKRESGSIQSKMIFKKSSFTAFEYHLPYGKMDGTVFTEKIINQINDPKDKKLEIHYDLYFSEKIHSKHILKIEII